jgi:hypothetical protein
MMKKKFLAVFLSFIFTLMLIPNFASAAGTTTTISSFSSATVLTYTQYDLLRTGQISAVKKNGIWYYQFKKNNDTLLVNTTAFSSSVGNNYKSVNDSLTKGIMRTDGVAQKCSYAYKARTSTTSRRVNGRQVNGLPTWTTTNTYETYISWLTIIGNRVGTEIDLECKKNGHVEFTFSDKVEDPVSFKLGYATPTTSREYMSALKRNTTNGVSTKMVPTFELDITKPGTNCVKLNSCMYRGKGIADTKTPITDYIDVALATGAVVKDLYTGSLSFKNLYKLYSQISGKMIKSSNEYTSNQKTYLSWNKKYTMKARFESPISLKVSNDYFRSEVRLSAKPSVSGTKTQMKVIFSVSPKN